MPKTRAQLVTSTKAATGRVDKGTVIEDALDFGLAALTRRHKWRQGRTTSSFTLAATDTTVTLDTGTTHVYWVVIEDGTSIGWKMRVYNERLYHQLIPNGSALGDSKPIICWQDGLTLRFSPGSDGVYTLKARVNKTQSFASDAATSPFDETDEALISYASAYTFRSIENFESAGQWESRFERLAAEAIRLDMSYPEDTPHLPFGFERHSGTLFFDVNDPFLMEIP